MVKVVFEDGYLLVIDKPPGLVVTSSETSQDLTLEEILKQDFKIQAERGGVVHRLDKDTSGLLVVAKSDLVLAKLQEIFKNRLIKKEYLALVHGLLETSGKIETLIGRNPGDREKFVVFLKERIHQDLNVREAVTRYEREANFQFSIPIKSGSILNFQKVFEGFNKIQFRKLERSKYNSFTLIRCFPETGRTHQIRVHLKYIGHPIVADDKYGGRKTTRLDKRWCPRQFLHAAKLTFNHPVTSKQMIFESPLPEDLKESLEKLEKADHGSIK